MSVFEPSRRIARFERAAHEFTFVTDGEVLATESTHRPSLAWFFALTACVLLALVSRLIVLQVAFGADHQLLADGNRVRTRYTLPPRGLILDRHGDVLAKNVAAFAVELVPADLSQDPEERGRVYDQAAAVSGRPREEIVALVEDTGLRSLTPLLLAEQLDHQQALEAKLVIGQLPGLRVVERARREYRSLPGLAHLLGYTGKVSPEDLAGNPSYLLTSIVGRAGLEATYESQLQGEPGLDQVEVDSRGYFQRVIESTPPLPGDDVRLTLNAELQERLGAALNAARTRPDAEEQGSAVGVALDPRDGSVLAMVSLPDYDNNLFARGIDQAALEQLTSDEQAPLTNRAIAGTYPSGSVIKPMVAAGGLADGIITPSTSINAPGEIRIGEWVFPDWKVHGTVNVGRAIAVSSNVFFYALGGGWESIKGLGVERLTHYLRLFGFGEPTGIDLPGEVAGLVPTPEWKERVKNEPWYLGDTYHLAIGQGDLLVTPVQIARATAAIANQGRLVTPHLFLGHQPNDSDRPAMTPPGPLVEELLPRDHLETVRAGMAQAVQDGSARQLQSLPVRAGAKTGTAQFGGGEETHAWFSAFAPYDEPEIVLVVLIEGGGAGNEVAMPVATEVLTWYFSRGSSPPTD